MKFSIIIPVYNVEKQIERCLKSIINQSYNDYEVIIIDDGSNDHSGEICDAYSKSDSRFLVIHKNNEGPSSARNAGIELATGDYIIFIDSDDYIENNYCESAAKIINKTAADIITIMMVFDKKGYSEERILNSKNSIMDSKDFLIRSMKTMTLNGEVCANIYRRNFWNKSGFIFKNGLYHEDIEISIKLFLKAETVAICPDARYHAVLRDDSRMTNILESQKRHSDLLVVISMWWMHANNETNKTLCRAIKGTACRMYISSCAHNNIINPACNVFSTFDVLKYSLNIQDFLKGLLFIASPDLYYYIWKRYKKIKSKRLIEII